MKKLWIEMLFSCAIILLVSACSPPYACTGIECGSYGTSDEIDCSCKCETGYETDADGKCETLASAKFVGNWAAVETCPPTTAFNYYTINLSAISGDLTKVKITNFVGTNCGIEPLVVTATIEGTSLKDFKEDCNDISGLSATCTLSTDGKTLTITYSMTDGTGTTYNCSATMTKQ